MNALEKKLLDAAIAGNAKRVAQLVKQGADVDARDTRGSPTNRTALMHAAENGHANVVDLLLNAGASVNATDKGFPIDCPGGNTALILAIENSHVAIAHRLLDAGASPKIKGGGTTPITAAAYRNQTKLVGRLIELGVHLSQEDASGFTPLSAAINGHAIKTVCLLLDLGADPNTRNPAGSSVLGDAAFSGDVRMCSPLIDAGADLNSGGPERFTPLMAACLAGHVKLVEFLLSCRARVDLKDRRGRTALKIVEKALEPSDLSPEVLRRRKEMGISLGPPRRRFLKIRAILLKRHRKTKTN